jgi:hypothetical protein
MLGENMKRYRGVVVFRYYQERTVEAENADQAQEIMYNEFHMRSSDGESEILDFEEINQGESK